jgi:transposase
MNIKHTIKSARFYSESERHFIIQDYLSSGLSKQAIWQKHTGQAKEHGQIIYWMRRLGYLTPKNVQRHRFVATTPGHMSTKKTTENQSNSSFELLQLQKRIALLEEQLKDAEMKAIAFSTMVDIAEKEFKIPIRKKFNTKP